MQLSGQIRSALERMPIYRRRVAHSLYFHTHLALPHMQILASDLDCAEPFLANETKKKLNINRIKFRPLFSIKYKPQQMNTMRKCHDGWGQQLQRVRLSIKSIVGIMAINHKKKQQYKISNIGE